MSLQDLREQLAVKSKAMKALSDKPINEWKLDVDGPAFDTLRNEYDSIKGQMERIEASNKRLAEDAVRAGVIEAADRTAKDKKSEGSRIFSKWMRGGIEALNTEELRFMNAQAEGVPSEGGYTVATDVATTVLDALKAYGGMRAASEVIHTTKGNPLSFPTSNGTSELGEIVAENGTASNLDLSFGVLGLPVYKFSSKVVTVPYELLEDSNVDIEAFVRQRLVTRLGRITNNLFTVGSGNAQPTGIVTAATVGRVGPTGQTTTIQYADLVELEHSVDPAYRSMEGVGYMMADQTLKVIRKITDSVGRPIFVPGYELQVPGGAPDTLLGRPIYINQDMPQMAANASSVLFGAFREYKIRDTLDIAMFRFTDSAFTIKGQVGFLAWLRSGGNLIDVGGGVKAYANSAT